MYVNMSGHALGFTPLPSQPATRSLLRARARVRGHASLPAELRKLLCFLVWAAALPVAARRARLETSRAAEARFHSRGCGVIVGGGLLSLLAAEVGIVLRQRRFV